MVKEKFFFSTENYHYIVNSFYYMVSLWGYAWAVVSDMHNYLGGGGRGMGGHSEIPPDWF